MSWLVLALSGSSFVIGAFGAIVGLGGGFLLMPLLLFVYPATPVQHLVFISLLAVFANSLAASVVFWRRDMVERRLAKWLAVFAVPGAWLGTYLSPLVPRDHFEILLGSVLLLVAGLFIWTKQAPKLEPSVGIPPRTPWWVAIASFVIGGFATFFGVGGGILLMPLLIHVIRLPVHRASATSQVVLCAYVTLSLLPSFFKGQVIENPPLAAGIVVSMVLGGQVGARVAPRIHAQWIIWALACVLFIFGIKLVF